MTSAELFERCIQATALCAKACDAVLTADLSYTTPGTEPYDEVHVALVSGTSVCTLLGRALHEGDGDIGLLRWCAEVCTHRKELAPSDNVPAAAWSNLVNASEACAAACNEVVDHIVPSRQKFGATPEHASPTLRLRG